MCGGGGGSLTISRLYMLEVVSNLNYLPIHSREVVSILGVLSTPPSHYMHAALCVMCCVGCWVLGVVCCVLCAVCCVLMCSLRFRLCSPLSVFFSICSKRFRRCAHRSRRFSLRSLPREGTFLPKSGRFSVGRAHSLSGGRIPYQESTFSLRGARSFPGGGHSLSGKHILFREGTFPQPSSKVRARRACVLLRRALSVFFLLVSVLVGAFRSVHFSIYALRFRLCSPLSAFVFICSRRFRRCVHRSRRFSGWSWRAPGAAKLEGARARAPRVRCAPPCALGVFPATICALVGALRPLHFSISLLRFRGCSPPCAFF